MSTAHGIDRSGVGGGTGSPLITASLDALVDPNADRILFWDDSAGRFEWLTPGSNLVIIGTTISTVENPNFSNGTFATLGVTGAATAGSLVVSGSGSFSNSVITTVINTNAAANLSVQTNGVEQLRVVHTASANRFVTITGSNGGDPTIATSAGNLGITPAVVVAATSGTAIGTTTSSSTALNLPAGAAGISSLRISHGVAPSSPVNGDIWSTSDGIVARINGTTVTFTGTTLSAEQTPGAVAVVDFAVPSWAKWVTVSLRGVSFNADSEIAFQLGDAGGIETSGYVGAAIQVANATAVAGANPTGSFRGVSLTSNSVYSGIVRFALENASDNTWTCSGQLQRSDAPTIDLFGGYKSLTQPLTTVRVTTSAGTATVDAGSISVQYGG